MHGGDSALSLLTLLEQKRDYLLRKVTGQIGFMSAIFNLPKL